MGLQGFGVAGFGCAWLLELVPLSGWLGTLDGKTDSHVHEGHNGRNPPNFPW